MFPLPPAAGEELTPSHVAADEELTPGQLFTGFNISVGDSRVFELDDTHAGLGCPEDEDQ